MNILTTIAQSYYEDYDTYSNTSNGTGADAATTGILVLMFMFIWFIFFIAIYIVFAICLMKIFKKAGVKPWIAWVPFYNSWKLYEIGGQQGFWAVLAIIPIVNLVSAVYLYIAMYHIGKKLGKEDIFVLWAIFLPVVWFIWLAVDTSTWNDKASSAPSLAA
ncbi:MAG: DUF5684 domain-containing protein [Patescibacteria group bacterium]